MCFRRHEEVMTLAARETPGDPAAPVWRREPFRVFFPLGVPLSWVGVGHWLLYTLGATASYSCLLHGLVQVQAFLMAFATGFLLTALPRRTGTAPPSTVEMMVGVALLAITTAAAVLERWAIAECAYAALFLLLLRFALVRFLGRAAGRRPPAAFVLIPLGVLHGLGGAALIAASTLPGVPAWTLELGRLSAEQGVFLCFAIGVGSLVLPLMAGAPPPADLDASPRERWKAAGYGAAGIVVFGSLVLELNGWQQAGPLVRAVVVALGLGLGGGAWRAPARPGLHRRLVWAAAWLMPVGLVAAGLWPDYRVPALHVLFVGGFGLLALGVATHVVLAHLDLVRLAEGRPPAVAVMGALLVLAMLARVAADVSDLYFEHVGWAAGSWLAGSAVWLAFVVPKLLRR
jgi:uncharacterized protein involved in response to NO